MKTRKPLSSGELGTIHQTLLEKTGRPLKGCLIEQAFTRSSYARRYGGGSNENLEYLGDTVLGYHVVRKLYEHYGTIHTGEDGCFYSFRAHEKDFTELKSMIVSNHTLAAIMDEWELCRYLIVGQSDIDNEIDRQEKIRADLLEAIIGAYAVQYGWDQKVLDEIVSKVLPVEQYILEYEAARYRPPEFSAENAVNTLKELAEHEKCSFPTYGFSGPDALGHDKNGDPRWCCTCEVRDQGIRIVVFAHSKKEAKKFAAYLVLCQMFELPNQYGPNKRLGCWEFDGERLISNPKFDS